MENVSALIKNPMMKMLLPLRLELLNYGKLVTTYYRTPETSYYHVGCKVTDSTGSATGFRILIQLIEPSQN